MSGVPYTGTDAGPMQTTFTIVADGEDVDAVSVNQTTQPLIDNQAYIARVFPNLETGGDYSALTADLSIGNVIHLASGAGIELLGGSVIQVDNSAGIQLGANAYLKVGGSLGVPGFVEVQNHGLIQVDSGGGIDVKSGAAETIEGQLVIENGGLLQVQSGASLSVSSGGALTTNAGSTATYAGRTTYAGAGAYRVTRKTKLTGTASGFAAESWDIVIVDGTFVVTLTDPGALPEGILVRFAMPGTTLGGSGGTVDVHDHGGTEIGQVKTGGSWAGGFVDLATINVSGSVVWMCVGEGQP